LGPTFWSGIKEGPDEFFFVGAGTGTEIRDENWCPQCLWETGGSLSCSSPRVVGFKPVKLGGYLFGVGLASAKKKKKNGKNNKMKKIKFMLVPASFLDPMRFIVFLSLGFLSPRSPDHHQKFGRFLLSRALISQAACLWALVCSFLWQGGFLWIFADTRI